MRGLEAVGAGRYRDRLRFRPWRGDADVAHLTAVPGAPGPAPETVRRCCRTLAERGFITAVTDPLDVVERQGFLDAGFTVREELHVLVHDLATIPDPPAVMTRRGARRDRRAALAVDALAFSAFWRLDELGFATALTSTPAARFRVATPTRVVAYAISGRAGRRGYLQRLAVDPALSGRGVGRALVIDALRWMRRHGTERAMVNTQLANERALRLYRGVGFRLHPARLAVLTSRLDDRQRAR
ncbi:MAG: GNAT family N-acetyltransferase [Acidimicrobiales bacterium]